MKTILYFTADWCGPCKKVRPIADELNREYFPGMFQIIDVDIEKEMTETFKINAVPTFILFDDGRESNRITGLQSRESLMEFVKNE